MRKAVHLKFVLILVFIIVSSLGIGYAYWGNSIRISTTIETGEIELSILSIEPVLDNVLDVTIYDGQMTGKAYLKTTVSPDSGKALDIILTVANTGTVPVFFEEYIIKPAEAAEAVIHVKNGANSFIYSYGSWEKTLIIEAEIDEPVPAVITEVTSMDVITLSLP